MNPLLEYIKLAGTTVVSTHIRRDKKTGKSEVVKAHIRKVSDKESAELQLQSLRARQSKELELWKTWKESGQSKEALGPLLKSFGGLINSRASVYKGQVRIPKAAIDAEFKIQFVNALRTFDPTKASLGTYVYGYLAKAKRFIVEHQNIARIPENRVYKIGMYKAAIREFSEDNDRPPTNKELAGVLSWPLPEVDKMESEDRDDFLREGFLEDPQVITPTEDEETLKLFVYELEGKEKLLYQHLTGYGKKQVSSTGELAKIMGMKDYQISRVKASLNKKLQEFI